jgi:pimeloyl-ACP methyl ester carboxylesterase
VIRPTLPRQLATGVALVAAVALLTACSALGSGSPDGTDGPTTTSTPAPTASVEPSLAPFYGQRLVWAGCGNGLRCSKLLVPVDYAHPTSGSIRLALIKLPTPNQVTRIGSLILNPGGPGGSGVDYARSARSVVDGAVRSRYDVVGFDPRGVARSAPVECLDDGQTDAFLALDATPDTPTEVRRLDQASRQFADECKARSPRMYAHIGTEDAARDVDVLRAALGDQKLYWLGASYGTFLGATYADLFPTRVGRMVLDGAIDPTLGNVELTHGQVKGFELALGRFVQDCQRHSDCPLPQGTQAGLDRIQRLFHDLDATPLDTGDPARPLTESLAENAVLSYLYFPPTDWEQLRFGLQSAFDGDGSVLLLMLDDRTRRDDSGHYANNSNAALYAVSALDRPDRPTADQSQMLADQWSKEAPIFGTFLAWGDLPFQYWSAPATGRPHAIHAPGSPKILVVGTTYDPATPYPWAQALAKQLSQGVLLTRVGDGHTGYGMGSQCTDTAIDRYLLTGVTPPAGTVCR